MRSARRALPCSDPDSRFADSESADWLSDRWNRDTLGVRSKYCGLDIEHTEMKVSKVHLECGRQYGSKPISCSGAPW
jgi:hypothetical protein